MYEDIVKLSFDGIGLDFIEGKKTAELIEKYGFSDFILVVLGGDLKNSDLKKQ